jgi:hypothetical protein
MRRHGLLRRGLDVESKASGMDVRERLFNPYEKALEAMLVGRNAGFTPDGRPDEKYLVLYRLVRECDHLTRSLVEGSDRMSDRFSSYARAIRLGHLGEDPTAYGTVRDITQNTARLEASRDALFDDLKASYGGGATLEQYKEALAKAFHEAR